MHNIDTMQNLFILNFYLLFPDNHVFPDQICNRMSLISNHHHVPNPNDCQTFYSCQKNHNHIGGYNAHLMECGPNTGFDVKLGICNYISKLPDCYRGN